MKPTKKILFSLLGCTVLIYILFVFYEGMIESSKNPIEMVKTPPSEYGNLFSLDAKQKLILDIGTSFKLRNNISVFYYDKKFSIELTKINSKDNFHFMRDIVETYAKPEGNFSNGAFPVHETNFITKYQGASNESASKIYLSFQGDSVRTILKNDSMAYYYLKLKNVYVQYHPKGIYEISIEANTKFYFFSTEQPVSILFLKRRNSLYFLLLTANDDSTKLDPNLLFKLISKE